jgi:hypothetical protein
VELITYSAAFLNFDALKFYSLAEDDVVLLGVSETARDESLT